MNHFYEFLITVFMKEGKTYDIWGGQDIFGWLLLISDSGLFISHISIALGLTYIKIRKFTTPFSSILWLFVAFSILGGLVHLAELTLSWLPWFSLWIFLKCVTAVASLYSALAFLKIIPRALELPGVAATRAHLSWIIESTPDAIVSCDVQGKILSWNSGAERHLGFTFEEVRGKHLNEFIPLGNTQEEVRKKILSIIEGKLQKPCEIKCLNKSGQMMTFLKSSSQLTNERRDIIGFCSILTDLTEKKSLEQTLKEKISELASLNRDLFLQRERLHKVNQELEHRNSELDSFAFLASHDLKSPLRAISLSADCLLTEIGHKIEPAHKKLLELLKGRSLSMQRLLDDLLLYAKVGTTIGQVEEINTYQLVCDVVKLLYVKEEASIEISPELPWLVSHRIPLQQIFQNLISNALKHNSNSQGVLVKVYAQEFPEYIKFSVEDNGPGIPEKYQEKIFMMFQTLKANDGEQGYGIGLAVVKKLIDKFNGKIEVQSALGGGSIFSFWWPKPSSYRNGGSSKPRSLRECN